MRSIFAALLLLASSVISTPAPGRKDCDCTKTVKAGQSIQAAIDSAKPGDKIIVEQGTYPERLTIKTSGITLIGHSAVLVPPHEYYPNLCTGLNQDFTNATTEAGICIHGEGVELANYVKDHRKFISAKTYIKNVVVTGFEVQNFSGENIAVVAGEHVKIIDNKLVNGTQYGFLTVGSKNTLAQGNTIATSAPFSYIAMCMDDQSGAIFKGNDLSGYFIALCGQTSGGLIVKNTVKDCCIGSFVDPGVKGARVVDNTVTDRSPFCPNEGGAGIVIWGAVNTIVKMNIIERINNNGTGVGIFINDDPETGAKAQGNVVKWNKFASNDYDIINNATIANDVLTKNQCDPAISNPPTACS